MRPSSTGVDPNEAFASLDKAAGVATAFYTGAVSPHRLAFSAASVPAPGSLALIGSGLLGLAGLRRRRSADPA